MLQIKEYQVLLVLGARRGWLGTWWWKTQPRQFSIQPSGKAYGHDGSPLATRHQYIQDPVNVVQGQWMGSSWTPDPPPQPHACVTAIVPVTLRLPHIMSAPCQHTASHSHLYRHRVDYLRFPKERIVSMEKFQRNRVNQDSGTGGSVSDSYRVSLLVSVI